MIKWSILKQFTQSFDGICIVRNASDIDIILINHIHYNYLEYAVIKYLYNNNKRDIMLLVYIYISKWLGLETSKKKKA